MTQTWFYFSFLFISFSFAEFPPQKSKFMDEICDNAKDDDGDGLVDINDPDCICAQVTLESLIPNPSFEEFTCCPNNGSLLECATGWAQASAGTTDYINTCNLYSPAFEQFLPFPDGEGIVSFLTGTISGSDTSVSYYEYTGTCLNRPLLKDSIYLLKFNIGFFDAVTSPEFNFSFYGSPSCSNLPFTDSFDCPLNYPDWFILQTERVSGSPNGIIPAWVEVTTVIQPTVDINALVMGGDCDVENKQSLDVYLLDNLRLSEDSNFDFELTSQPPSTCDPNFTFAVKENPLFSYQWYLEGIALIGETNAELSQMYGEGNYQLKIINNVTQQCRVADDFEYVLPFFYTQEAFEVICTGRALLFEGDTIDTAGVYEYTLLSIEGCDSIVTLNVALLANVSDTIFEKKLADATFSIGDNKFTEEGEYLVTLDASNGCDSTVLLFLENIDVYIPNAFSPNNDGFNDYFEVFTSDDDFVKIEMYIFDRWGSLLYEGNKWNGKSGNRNLDPGVYVYLVKLMDASGEEIVISKDIALFR